MQRGQRGARGRSAARWPAARGAAHPPQRLRFQNRLPKVALETRLITDWEDPGYWLTKDNRDLSPAAVADLLADHPAVSLPQLQALRGVRAG